MKRKPKCIKFRMNRKPKCVRFRRFEETCDNCKKHSTKCPYRDKYRDLRNTKYGKEKYGLEIADDSALLDA